MAAFFILTLPGQSQEGQAKALLIGTQDFVSPSFGSLVGIATDLELMKTTLIGSCGLSPANVTTVLSTRSNVVSRASVVKSLEDFFQSAGPNDALLVYVTTHGVVYDGEYQIAVTETRLSNDQIKQTSIGASQLRKWSERSKAKTVLVVLDTCQSLLSQQLAAELTAEGKAMSNTASAGFTSQVATKFLGNPAGGSGVRAILYSCRPSEQSYMDTNYLTGTNNSYFTLALCEGLQGKAAAPNGEVSLQSLTDYTSRRLSELIEADRHHRLAKGASPDQLPNQQSSNMEVLGGQPSTFVLATVRAGVAPSVGSPYATSAQSNGAAQPGYLTAYPGQNHVTTGYPNQSVAVHPAVQSPYPVGQSTYPAAQPGYPVAQATYPAAQPGYPVAQSTYPAAQPGYPVAQSTYPSAQPGYPVGQSTYPSAQPGYPVVQAQAGQPQVVNPPSLVQAGSPTPPGYPAVGSAGQPLVLAAPIVQPAQSGPVAVAAVPGSSSQQTETTKVSGGMLEIFPSSEFLLAAADVPVAAKGLSRDTKAAAAINGSDFTLSLRCDRGESDANVRVTVQSGPEAAASNVYLRVLASPDRQNWFPIRDWSFRLPGGYRVSRDYVGADPQLFAHQVFFMRAELVLPNNAVVVREARFTATPSR